MMLRRRHSPSATQRMQHGDQRMEPFRYCVLLNLAAQLLQRQRFSSLAFSMCVSVVKR